MPKLSVLYPDIHDSINTESVEMPDFFVDLNLDQVVTAVTAHRQDYNLKPFFFTPLRDVETVNYRQAVSRDLESAATLAAIKAFAEKMVVVRRYLKMITTLYYKYHKEGWFLEAAALYGEAVSRLAEDLSPIELHSQGLIQFRDYLNQYIRSSQFLSLQSETHDLKEQLKSVQYNVIIKGDWVRVRKYEGEIDYSQEVEKTFEKFKQGEVKNYRVDLIVTSGMNHIEAQILDCAVKLYPEIFKALDDYCPKYVGFLDDTIVRFDREIQFYLAYLEFIHHIKGMGLAFCYPRVSSKSKEVQAAETYDIALANKRMYEKSPIVVNDYYLKNPERIIVISGPNQGGKTTFARTFGQLHYLASLGLPIPGREAQLFLCDRIFTHFENQEDIRNLRGKLQDDLFRIRTILDQATPDSIIIMNEIFTSTTLRDAIFLGEQIMKRIIALDCLSVCVSFIDELSTMSEKTISMVSTVVPNNPAVRTFKIIRKNADGIAHAITIAEKHRLTYELIKERMAQ